MRPPVQVKYDNSKELVSTQLIASLAQWGLVLLSRSADQQSKSSTMPETGVSATPDALAKPRP
jgi:hypothetical protein